MIRFLIAWSLAVFCFSVSANAATPVQVETYQRDGYVRIIIAAPAKQSFRADLSENILTVGFDEAVTGDLAEPVAAAPSLITAARHSNETDTLRFTLSAGALIHVSQSMNVIAIDVIPEGSTATPRNIVSFRELAVQRAEAFFETRYPSLKSAKSKQREKPPILGSIQPSQEAFPQNFDLVFNGFRSRVAAEGFPKVEEQVLANIAAAPETGKLNATFNAALFYMAFDLDAEALAVISGYLDTDEENPFALLAAITSLRMGRFEDAIKYLSSRSMRSTKPAYGWRAVAFAAIGAWQDAAADFSVDDADFDGFPEYSHEYHLGKAETLLALGETESAAGALRSLKGVSLSPHQRASRNLIEARIMRAKGLNKEALDLLTSISSRGNASPHQRARIASIELQTATGDLPPSVALEALETAALDWRGGLAELERLQLVAKAADAAEEYAQAFAARSALIANFPEADAAKHAAEEQRKALISIANAPALSPMLMARLFYDNVQYAPPGAAGDTLIRSVAAQLRSLDLLSESAELLEHQVFSRLKGSRRAEAAINLATVYLENAEPDEALRVIRSTRFARLSDDVARERLLIEGEALAQRKDWGQAVNLLKGMEDPEASQLRGDVAWEQMEWLAAAQEYAASLPSDTAFSADDRLNYLKAVSGYAMAGEIGAAQRLSEEHAQSIAGDQSLLRLSEAMIAETFSGSINEFLEAAAIEFQAAPAET